MLDIIGIQELQKQLEKMSNAPNKVTKKALNEAGKVVKKEEQEVAKKTHNVYGGKVGWRELKKFPVTKSRSGYQFVDIGIKGKLTNSQKKKDQANMKAGKSRPTYWDKVKGLYFNHYGFVHNRTGEYIAGSDWMNTAFENSKDKAAEIIKSEIIKELGL